MKKTLITLLVCTSIFSCSKNDDLNNSSNKDAYKPENVIIADAAVMYTKNGVVQDQALIKGYLTRRNIPLNNYSFDKSAPSASSLSSYTLEFKAGKSVLIGDVNAEIVDKNDSMMLISVMDSSVPVVGKTSWSDSLMNKVDKNGPLAECPTYYTSPCPYKKKYPLQIINGQYYIPYVVATTSTNAFVPTSLGAPIDYTVVTYKAGQSMIFNKSMTTQLGGTVNYHSNDLDYTLERFDTVVIQTMRQHLIKQ